MSAASASVQKMMGYSKAADETCLPAIKRAG
jgi:hypothetical protein